MNAHMISRDWAHNNLLKYMPEKDRVFLQLPNPCYRVAVIGTGVNGQEHIRCTHFEGRATIRGVYDPNEGSRAAAQREHEKYAITPLIFYKSLQEACMDDKIDAFIIATPNHTHRAVLQEVMKSHKPILLEKPMAHTIRDAYEILRMVEQYEALVQLGMQYRYKSMYREAIYEVLQRKSLGEIKMMYICEHRIPFLDKVGQWNKFSKKSGGTLVEKCCHYFDLFNLFAQSRPVRVFASASQAINFTDFTYEGEKSDILDNAIVTIEYQNGIRANFNLCMFAPQFYEELSLCGDAGRLRCFEKQDFPGGEESDIYLEILRGEIEPARIMKPRYPHAIERLGHHGSTFIEHVQFVDALTQGRRDSATAEQGFWAVVVGTAAEESAQCAQPVVIDELLQRLNIAI